MSDSNSTDSFENIKPEELPEGFKSPSTQSISSYATARDTSDVTSTSDGTSFRTAASDLSISSTLRDMDELTFVAEDDNHSQIDTMTDGSFIRGRVDDGTETVTSSWHDMEHDAVSAWIPDASNMSDFSEKKNLIREFTKKRDVKNLKKLAEYSEGLVSDDLRRNVWPIITKTCIIPTSPMPDLDVMRSHPFYTQVVMDVNRSLKRFPPSIREEQRLGMQDQLVQLIMRILIKNPGIYYYQGYHDICVTFLLILGPEMAFHVLNVLSESHLSIFMEESMESTSTLLKIIPEMIRKENPELSKFLTSSGVGTIFCLSWIITWFSHVLKNYDTVGRLFDLFISSHKYTPLYLTTAMILFKENEILKLDCDMASVHQYLTRFIEEEEDEIPFELLIRDAKKLMTKYPPSDMEAAVKILREKEKRIESRRRMMVTIKKLFTLRGLLQVIQSKKGIATISLLVLCVASFASSYFQERRLSSILDFFKFD